MAGSSFRGTSSVLLVVAVAATVGFLYWVYDQAQAVDQTVTPQMADTASAQSNRSLTVESLAENPEGAIGRETVLDSVEVAGSLGRGVFTLALNDSVAFPVLLGSQLLQRGTTVYGGDQVSVGGRIYTLNDSITGEWAARGAVDSASVGDIPSMPAFMLADSVDIQS